MEKKLLTEEEIKDLKNFTETNTNHIYWLGQIEYQKILLEKEKEILIEDVLKTEKEKEILSQKLSDKYGPNGRLDLDEGVIFI